MSIEEEARAPPRKRGRRTEWDPTTLRALREGAQRVFAAEADLTREMRERQRHKAEAEPAPRPADGRTMRPSVTAGNRAARPNAGGKATKPGVAVGLAKLQVDPKKKQLKKQ